MKTSAPLRPVSHKRPAPFDRFWFGACYYPEHWDAPTRAHDAERMAAAGFNLVRMAEFAWDLMEPQPEQFDFSLFDQTIEILGNAGIRTLLCTPTATPPRWLTLRHPDMVRATADGVPLEHGSRQHCCHAHPIFRAESRRITKKMAAHFRDNPHVAGWQTDNEIYCHFQECHCAACQKAFAAFLKNKFSNDIDALNRAWGTQFWSQTYRNFTDIRTPKPDKPTYLNPAHVLDYRRYLTTIAAEFQREQIVELRAAQPRWWITHNGIMSSIDYRGPFTQDLDVLGYDCYPLFCNDPEQRPAQSAVSIDAARAWSGNFIIPEQQSGPGGQMPYFQDHPEPGELRKMTYVSIARGADSLLYFRWRTCRFGAEEYWCGILDHDNVPRRRYAEVQQVGEELTRVGPRVLGTHVHVDVAVAGADFDSSYAPAPLNFGLPGGGAIGGNLHAAFYKDHYAIGVVHPADDLRDIRLYFVPHWPVFNPAWLPALEAWVNAGGTLVIGARTATRDLNNSVVPETIPGCLQPLAGITVEEYGRKNIATKRPLRVALGNKSVLAEHWYEMLKPQPGTRTLATWKGRHLTGSAACTIRSVGKGHVIYVGTYLTPAVIELLMPRLLQLSGLKSLWPGLPTGVEAVQRRGPAHTLWFFINHNERAATLKTAPKGIDLITNRPVKGSFRLAPNAVAIIEQPAKASSKAK